MKTKYLFLLGFCFITGSLMAQTPDDILNVLISKNLVTQAEADSIRAEASRKAQDAKEKQKSFFINARRAINISGYAQIRFQSFQESGRVDYADVRRARLDFRGNVTPTWEYRLQFDLASSPKLLDGYAAFKPYDFLKLQAGQFKVPFSLENLAPSNNMETIDRSQVVEALVARGRDVLGNHNGRDIGVQASGSLVKINDRFIVDYFVAGFNGNGINTADNNEPKDAAARIVLHPVKGLDIGASYYNGYDKYGTPTARNRVRTRMGGELVYIYKFASLRGEYIEGEDGGIERSGYYAQLSAYIYKKKLQLVGRYDAFDPDTDKDDDAMINYLGGINFFFNDWAKIQVNVTNRTEEGESVNNDIIGVQLQIGF
jgi:phosphate-selective porin OprO and OprP